MYSRGVDSKEYFPHHEGLNTILRDSVKTIILSIICPRNLILSPSSNIMGFNSTCCTFLIPLWLISAFRSNLSEL